MPCAVLFTASFVAGNLFAYLAIPSGQDISGHIMRGDVSDAIDVMSAQYSVAIANVLCHSGRVHGCGLCCAAAATHDQSSPFQHIVTCTYVSKQRSSLLILSNTTEAAIRRQGICRFVV